MKTGGRLQAAIEVLEDVLTRRTPATMALRDWGKAHRFAGSKDRNAIGNIVHDVLRHRSSLGWQMDDEAPRALVFAYYVLLEGHSVADMEAAFKDDRHSPAALSEQEKARLEAPIKIDDAPNWVKADVPEWLWPAFENNFADDAVAEGHALCARPPLDIRVNTLKSARDDASSDLADMGFVRTDISPTGLRAWPRDKDGRQPNIQSEKSFQLGHVEIQDEGSQIVSQLIDAKPGEIILDYCAGGGGKSLAMAAEMNDEGRIHAFDIDKRRLTPLYQRAMRAGANCINVCEPPENALEALIAACDRVVIDAPCTGVGTWRRKPDAKWRVSEDALTRRNKEQQTVLMGASKYVRPGGLMFYITCSMLAEENEAQVYAFLDQNPGFSLLSAGEVWEENFGTDGL